MVMLSDESLVAGMANGDQQASAEFVRRYQARVYGLALTIVGVPALAEEVAQDGFVKAWRGAATYDPRRGRVSTWLLAITRNAAIDAIRYRHEQPMDPDVLMSVLVARGSADEGTDLATPLRLRQALSELPREQAAPILMMTYYGWTANEIASESEVPLGTVKTRIRRGLLTLRSRLGVRDG
jgi:RNA polymerase sigma-70 factor (ECF subfamily)